jgi:ribonuclease J
VIIESEDEALRERKRLASEGAINISIAVNGKRAMVAGPHVSLRGLAMEDEEDLDLAMDELERTAEAAFNKLNHAEREEDETVEAVLVRAVRKAAERLWSKRPLVDVSVLRI